MEIEAQGKTILFYDGVCKFCDKFVNFLIDRDTNDCLRFAALQSEFAENLLNKYAIKASELKSLYVITNYNTPQERIQDRSEAGIAAISSLKGNWVIIEVLRVFPLFLRDIGYRIIAHSRHSLLGVYDKCRVPTAELARKYIS